MKIRVRFDTDGIEGRERVFDAWRIEDIENKIKICESIGPVHTVSKEDIDFIIVYNE